MITFFDYIFYKLYRWNIAQNKFIKPLAPYQDDVLFSAYFGLSIFQGFNIYTIIALIAIVIKKMQWATRIDYIIIGADILLCILNYYYYIHSNRYKDIIKVFGKRKSLSNFPIILYLVLSLLLGMATVVYYKYNL